MARLEMVVEYEKGKTPRAELILKAALNGLAVLRAIERNLTKRRTSRYPWQVDIVSSFGRSLIVFRCENAGADAVAAKRKESHDV